MVLSSELLGCGAVTLRKQTVMDGVIVRTAGMWSCYLKETNSHEWCYRQNCWDVELLL